MSWQAQAMAWTFEDVSPLTKLVALSLANHASGDGSNIHPGMALIKKETRSSEASIKRSIKDLLEKEHLELVHLAVGRGNANFYKMPIDMIRIYEFHKWDQNAKRVQERLEMGSDENVKGFKQENKRVQGEPLAYREEPKTQPKTQPKKESTPPAEIAAPPGPVAALPGFRSLAQEFDAFYRRYPLKKARLAAEAKFAVARKRASFDEIMAGLERYQPPPGISYAHPATWLHQGRWMDEDAPVPSSPQNGAAADPSDPWGINAWAWGVPDKTLEVWHDGEEAQPSLAGYMLIPQAVEVCESTGFPPSWRGDLNPIAEWLRAGISADATVDAIRNCRGRPTVPTLRYFEASVRALGRAP